MGQCRPCPGASSCAAAHGGAACGPCDSAQRANNLSNVTGVQESAGGSGRINFS